MFDGDNYVVQRRKNVLNPFTNEYIQVASRSMYSKQNIYEMKLRNIDVEHHIEERVIYELNMKYHETSLGFYREDYDKTHPAHLFKIDIEHDELMHWTIVAAIKDVMRTEFKNGDVDCYMSNELLYHFSRLNIYNYKDYYMTYTAEFTGSFIFKYINDFDEEKEREIKIYNPMYYERYFLNDKPDMSCLLIDRLRPDNYKKILFY